MRLLRTHGLKTKFDDYGNLDYIYDVIESGYKYDMSDIAAAFGIAQLKKTDSFIEKRKKIANKYYQELKNIKHISLSKPDDEHIYSQYIIQINRNRDSFARMLKEKGISTGLHFIPLHLLTYYRTKYELKITQFPEALNIYQRVLSLPIYPSLSDEEVDYICNSIKEIAKTWV
jgi:dTDP-4-amino-4,6-dideoxygalactose transaminase